MTTTPGFADIAKQIGGEHVSAEAVMRGPEDVHNVSPRPTQMLKVKHADLFIHAGLDGEAWVPLLIQGARNPRLFPGQPGNVDVSRGIELKEVPQRGRLTRALGDIHVFGNTHYYLDPLNGMVIARTIATAFETVDPSHRAAFEANYVSYAKRLQEMTDRLTAKLKPYAGTPVVTYHRAWPYFLDRFGLVAIAEVEPKPGIAPGPQHLSECVELMRERGAKIVIVETYNSRENADALAHRAGGQAVVLAQEVRALPDVDTYESLFEHNVNELLRALQETGVKPQADVAAGTTAPGQPQTP